MKKNQVKTAKIAILGYSAAMAISGSMISFDAAAACTAGGAASAVTCGYTTASTPFAEAWSFTGSNNIKINDSADTTGYAACASHNDGTKSFGLTLAGGTMAIVDATGKLASLTAGCAS